MAYVQACCVMFSQILAQDSGGRYTIGARELVEQAMNGLGEEEVAPKPEFFSEVTRQTRFVCTACGTRHDILGLFAYCSCCGTRNDIRSEEHTSELQSLMRI